MFYIILVFYYLFGILFFVLYNFYYRQRNVEGVLVDSELLNKLMSE
jgi:hypothetical protein